MSYAPSCRRSHSKSNPLHLRNFQSPKDSLIVPPHPLQSLKPKLNFTNSISNHIDTPLLSHEVLGTKSPYSYSNSRPKKRVKLNSINSLVTQSIARLPLKTPRSYKPLPATLSERTSLAAKPYFTKGIPALKEKDTASKALRAPKFGKMGAIRKKTSRKTNDFLHQQRSSMWNQGGMSTRLTDTSLMGSSPGSNMLDSTSAGPGSLDDLMITDQSLLTNVDKAEDFNRKLRNIFRGEHLEPNNEADSIVAEERPDLQLKVFTTKPLLSHFKQH